MVRKSIKTSNAPAPIGPYNQAVKAGDTLYISGQIALDAADGSVYQGDIKIETGKVMDNLKAILTEAGMGFDQVVKTSIFLMDMGQFGAVNEVYATYFTDNYPARETIQVAGLPRGVQVEISMIAVG